IRDFHVTGVQTCALPIYVNRFKTDETSIFIDVENRRFRAVLDHHGRSDGQDKPTWRDHTASFTPKQSREWTTWSDAHEEWYGQRSEERRVGKGCRAARQD